MVKKASSPRKARSSKVKAALTVAAIVGYDPALLLAAGTTEVHAEASLTPGAPVAQAPEIVDVHAEVVSLSPDEYALVENTIELEALVSVPVDEAVAQAFEDVSEEHPSAEAFHVEPAPMSAVEEFAMHFAAVLPETVIAVMEDLTFSFDDRAAYETEKNPTNDNIHKTLRKLRQELTRSGSVRALKVCGVSPGFAYRQNREGARYNVYAIDKVADLASYLAGNVTLNRINNAVLRSLFRFEAASLEFTGELAKAAASDKIRVEPRYRPHLVSHTVAAGTAPTQASSTMQALQTLGIVKAEGSSKNPVYRLTDNLATKVLRERLAA